METIRDTYHVYLDSEASTQTGNTHYFPISPSIDVMYPQKGYIYLKEFSGFNNLHNVTSENNSFTLYFEDSNGNQVETELLDIQATNYPSLTKLVEAIEKKIQSLQVGDPAEAEAKGLKFSIVDQKVRVYHVTQKFKLEGFIFNDLIDIPFADTYYSADSLETAIRSTNEPDILKHIHNVYISVQEIKSNNRDVGTAQARHNRLCKIPVTTNFGEFIYYQAQAPVIKMVLGEVRLHQLHVELFSDDGKHYTPPKFTLTLGVEIADPVKTPVTNPLAMPDGYDFSKDKPTFNLSYPQFCHLRN
jgi:hypothetical protein